MKNLKNILQNISCLLTVSLAMLSGTAHAESKLYFVHTDHLGTPQVLTDQNQNVVWKGEYTPFGEVTEVVNTIGQNIRFPGQYHDRETGYYYNYYRDYDPTLGRYIQSDPIGILRDYSDPQLQLAMLQGVKFYSQGHGLNHLYGYAYQNPLIYVDPDGLNGRKKVAEALLCFVLGVCGDGDLNTPDKVPGRKDPTPVEQSETERKKKQSRKKKGKQGGFADTGALLSMLPWFGAFFGNGLGCSSFDCDNDGVPDHQQENLNQCQ